MPTKPADVELVSLEDVEEPEGRTRPPASRMSISARSGSRRGRRGRYFPVEEEEEGGDVTGLLDGGPAGKEDEAKSRKRAQLFA